MRGNHKTHSDPPDVITERVIREEIDEISPPPSLQGWLLNIRDKEKPEKSITTYNFSLFESADDYTIFLVGINRSRLNNKI